MSIAAMKQALEALELGQDAFTQAFGGYGYYRPDNPHNFFPDPECCTEKEIAYHSAACEAYDKGTYVPDHSDGWITPELHVTKAPWGIGTYTDECKEITEAIAALRAAIAEQEKCEPVATVKIVEHLPDELEMLAVFHPPSAVSDGTKLYTHPQPIPAGMVLVPVEPTKTGDPEISREHLVAIAEKCGLLGAYRTREVVDAIVGYGQVLLRNKTVQETMYRAALSTAPKEK